MNNVDPTRASSLEELAACMQQVRLQAGMPSYRELESRTRHQGGFIPGTSIARMSLTSSTISTVLRGKTFPRKSFLLTFVEACGINVEADRRWEQTWDRLALERTQGRFIGYVTDSADGQTDLLLRVYIPSERLYALEADRLMSLFRDWLMTTRGHGVRQASHSNASGKMYEFFADVSTTAMVDLREDIDNFSNFLTLCSEDPSAAADMLAPMGLERATSVDFVARFGKEVRRLQIDLTHERERRILTIRHSLEEELVNNGVELHALPRAQINALIEGLVPGPTASDSLALLAAPQSPQTIPPIALNINQQFINAIESTIIQNVQGTVHLGPQAKELLALIDRFGGQEAPLLEAAVHEMEDLDVPLANRSAAKQRLKKFLGQVAGMAHDVGIHLLEKYLDSKIGF
jgi:hypothetical protein